MITAGWDDRACLWRVEDGGLEAVLTGHESKLPTPDFSPDGTLLATPDEEGSLRLWRAQAGGDIARKSIHTAPVTGLTVSKGTTVSVGEDGFLGIWQTSTDRTRTCSVGRTLLETVTATEDGSLLAIGDADGQISIVESATGSVGASWPACTNGIHALRFSPDGMLLASAGGDTTIHLWNPATGQLERELLGHENDVNGLATDPDSGTLFSVSSDGTVRHWLWRNGEEVNLFYVGEPLYSIAYTPVQQTPAAGSQRGRIYLWDLEESEPVPLVLPSETAVRALAFVGDGKWLATGGDDGQISPWDLESREAVTIPAHGAHRVDNWRTGRSMTCSSALGQTAGFAHGRFTLSRS